MMQHWNKQKTQPMLTDMLPSPPSMEQNFQCFQWEIFPFVLRCSTVWSHWCLALKDNVAYDRKRRESSGRRLLLSWSDLLVSLAIAISTLHTTKIQLPYSEEDTVFQEGNTGNRYFIQRHLRHEPYCGSCRPWYMWYMSCFKGKLFSFPQDDLPEYLSSYFHKQHSLFMGHCCLSDHPWVLSRIAHSRNACSRTECALN